MARGGKEKERAVKRKQERKMEKEAKRAKDSQGESARVTVPTCEGDSSSV